MTEMKFEGNLEGINDAQFEYIRTVLENRGFKNETVEVLAVGKVDDNFVANVKRFVVKKNGKTFKMIGKIAPQVEMLRKIMNAQILFHNEHFMYSEVLRKFTELEIAAGIPESERLRYAGFYGSQIEEPNEVILLEDLQVSDFVIFDKTVSLTDETIRMVLTNFARLHAYSFVLKHQEPETFKAYSSKLTNNWKLMHDNPETKMYFDQMENDIFPVLDEKQQAVIRGNLNNLTEIVCENLKNNDPKYTVINQGDPWTNNIMFKLKNGVPIECCMIDYQISSEGSPATDLEYMLFNCTDHETRSKHFPQWINYYHKELHKCLSKFGLSVDEVYPREVLDADLKRHGKQFVGTTVMMATMLMRETAETAHLKETWSSNDPEKMLESGKLEHMEKSSLARFIARTDGLVKSFVELGLVDL